MTVVDGISVAVYISKILHHLNGYRRAGPPTEQNNPSEMIGIANPRGITVAYRFNGQRLPHPEERHRPEFRSSYRRGPDSRSLSDGRDGVDWFRNARGPWIEGGMRPFFRRVNWGNSHML
jgi:hypothetical protein